MMKMMLIERADGGISIAKAPEDPENYFRKWKQSAAPEWLPATFKVGVYDCPKNRDFRDAWVPKGGKVEVDMEKARAIHMAKIRATRDGELPKLDVEYMRADELGDPIRKSEIAQKKQYFRDLPQKFDLKKAKTPDELKALWPKGLPEWPG